MLNRLDDFNAIDNDAHMLAATEAALRPQHPKAAPGNASTDSPSRQCGTMMAPTTRTGWSPAATGCCANDAPSGPDISATTSATVSRSASGSAVNSAIRDSTPPPASASGQPTPGPPTPRTLSPSGVASFTATVETGSPERGPITRLASSRFIGAGGCLNVAVGFLEVRGALRVRRVVRLDRDLLQRDIHRSTERGDGREQP